MKIGFEGVENSRKSATRPKNFGKWGKMARLASGSPLECGGECDEGVQIVQATE